MKKFAKMSLVAAVAVAGLTTTSSAVDLEQAIKDTKLKGYVRYRLNNDYEKEDASDFSEEAKAVFKFTTPVNDMVTANVKLVSEAVTDKEQTKADTGVTEANFVVKAGPATVIAGLQTTQSPFFANNGDTRAHGATALVAAGPVTVAGAYYTTTVGGGLTSGPAMLNDVMALGAIGKMDALSFEAWYANVQDGEDVNHDSTTAAAVGDVAAKPLKDASAMNISAGFDAGVAKVEAMHTMLENGDVEGTLTKLMVSGKAGIASFGAAYAMTGDEALGGQVTLDNDSDAKSDLAMEVLNMQATTDASAFYVMGGVKATDQISFKLAYLGGSEGDKGNDESFNELNLCGKYQMSKNFYAKAWYAMGEYNKGDFANSRIEIKYSF